MSKPLQVDLSYLYDICAGDEELIAEMISIFLKDAPESIQRMSVHYESEDLSALAAEAHKLKPNLSYMGLDKARDLIVELEGQAKKGEDLPKIGVLLDQFSEQCGQSYSVLQQKLENIR